MVIFFEAGYSTFRSNRADGGIGGFLGSVEMRGLVEVARHEYRHTGIHRTAVVYGSYKGVRLTTTDAFSRGDHHCLVLSQPPVAGGRKADTDTVQNAR